MKRLYKSVSTFSLLTLLSRLLGFGRDVIWAVIFGASGYLDAFLVAFKIPNFMRRIFAEGAFSQAFLPVLVEYNNKHDKSTTLKFINNLAGNLALILSLLCLIVVLFAHWVILLFAPGFYFNPEKWHLAAGILRLTFPYILLISFTAFIGAILNQNRHFAAPAAAPILLNLSFIGCAFWLGRFLTTPIYALAWAVLIGGLLQLLLQLAVLKRFQPLPRLTYKLNHPGTKRFFKLLLPALVGVSATQISLLIDTLFASILPSGSLSWLYYSERLIHLPQGVFGVAIATVIMPELASNYNNQHHHQFKHTLDWAIQNILTIALPASAGLAILAGPILAVLFQHGQFTFHDVMMTRYSLWAYTLGLPAFMLIKVLTSSFYAQQNMTTPFKIALIAVAANLVLNILLIKPLGHAGLALATSLSSWINAFCLIYSNRKQATGARQYAHWKKFSLQLIIANSLMIGWLYIATPHLAQWVNWPFKLQMPLLIVFIISALGLYGASLWLSGFRLKTSLGAQHGTCPRTS